MTFSFDDMETGVETSRPREFFNISHGTTTYLVAGGDRDISYNGDTYVASPVARTDLQIDHLTASVDLALVLPANHPLVFRYLAQLSPPGQIRVVVRRLQLGAGLVEQVWDGLITSMSIDGPTAKFAVPSRVKRSLERKLPSVLVDRACSAILYDPWCNVDRSSFEIDALLGLVDGRVVHVDTVGGNPDQWFQFGELVHVPSGERQTIWDQTGLIIKLQANIPEMKFGDAVKLAPGCLHTVDHCRNKFSNIVNYVGLPNRPTKNPFVATGLGVNQNR